MAILDTAYYRGTDRYSDGDEAENRILEIVRAGKALSDLETEEVSWPVLYHLSPVRENICSWIPFPKGGRILEIGAGCGAVTGALCRSGAEVCSVDLSLRRLTINYERHKEYDNLHLYAGNLHDMPFGPSFDAVVVNGVLEYAGRFSEGPDPYRAFLEQARQFLKPEGKLYLAIENRFGLKYFAGAEEDHLGRAYAGIRGYDPADGVRTFSRSELMTLLREAGFPETRFYYPYPDYKFPLEIFTDETLASGHYGRPYLVFDKDRTLLFPEEKVAAVLAEDGAAAALANSFLVEAGTQPLRDPEKILYVKLNTERREDFRIGTKITEKGGACRAEKFALCDAAQAHLRTIRENERKLSACCTVLEGTEEDGKLVYPFLRQQTLEGLLRDAVNRRALPEVWSLLEKMQGLAAAGAADASYRTEGFTAWFGPENASKEVMPCVQPANVDCMADNVFADGAGNLTVTDCEWVTGFPVPAAFLLWRSLERACAALPKLEELVPKAEIFRHFGIGEADLPAFAAWSRYFENEYAAPRSGTRFGKCVFHSDQDLAGIIAEKRQTEERLREILDSRSWRIMQVPRKAYWKLFGKAEEKKQGSGRS